MCTLHALFLKNSKLICSKNGGTYAEINYTANVYIGLQGLYGGIRVRELHITCNPCNFEISTL